MTDNQRELLTDVIAKQATSDDTSEILEACYDVVEPPECTEAAMAFVGEIIELIDCLKGGESVT